MADHQLQFTIDRFQRYDDNYIGSRFINRLTPKQNAIVDLVDGHDSAAFRAYLRDRHRDATDQMADPNLDDIDYFFFSLYR